MVRNPSLLFHELELRDYYKLCFFCTLRHYPSAIDERAEQISTDFRACFICRGLMNQIDHITAVIESEVIDSYQFDSFSIGISLPHNIFDREDLIRARHKLRGNESIKSQLQNELRKRFQKRSGKKMSFCEPDLSINLIISQQGETKVIARSRPVAFVGRYIKKQRGISQRKGACKECEGKPKRKGKKSKDWRRCVHSGRSVEDIIATELVHVVGGTSTKFSWVGGEDSNSLVSGKGRPFFVRLLDPRLRSLKGGLFLDTPEIQVIIEAEPRGVPQSPVRFITKAKVLVKSSEKFGTQNLEDLSRLNSSNVKFQCKNRQILKRIYSIEVTRVDDRCFEMQMLVEGGFTIKKFVSGYDNTTPNVSQIIGSMCETRLFDISEVILQ